MGGGGLEESWEDGLISMAVWKKALIDGCTGGEGVMRVEVDGVGAVTGGIIRGRVLINSLI